MPVAGVFIARDAILFASYFSELMIYFVTFGSCDPARPVQNGAWG